MMCSWVTFFFLAELLVVVTTSLGNNVLPLREPRAILPDSATDVTSVTLAVRICRNSLETAHPHGLTIAFTSRAFVVIDEEATGAGVIDRNRATGDCSVPGPTLVLVPGGALNITIRNELEPVKTLPFTLPDDPVLSNATAKQYRRDVKENHWHKINTTNLHTHGLHVDPAIDDPFRQIRGGESGNYYLPIPRHHAPGMHWYHTHTHGATALHLMGGLFGMIFVEYREEVQQRWRKKPTMPPSVAASLVSAPQEHSFRSHVLRDYTLDRFSVALHMLKFVDKASASPHAGWSFHDLDVALRNGVPSNTTIDVDVIAVNGQFQPVLHVLRGVPFVVHMVFASAFGEPTLQIPPSCFAAVLAADGISYETPRRVRHLKFVSATRFDVLFQCQHEGVARVLHDTHGIRAAATYAAAVQRLGIEPNVLFGIHASDARSHSEIKIQSNVVDRDTTQWPFFDKLSRKHFAGHRNPMLTDLQGATPSIALMFERDVSVSQVVQQRQIHELERGLRSAGSEGTTITSGAPRKLPVVYTLGQGTNCSAVTQVTSIQDDDQYASSSTCTYATYQGRRGNAPERYGGFVVPRDSLVQLRLIGDPLDERPHPMHFHVNQFQLISYTPAAHVGYVSHGIEAAALGNASAALSRWGLEVGDWRDTIPALEGVTVVRWLASDFTGEIVYHCHTPSHEDLGMMSSYLVLNESAPSDVISSSSSNRVFGNAAVPHNAMAVRNVQNSGGPPLWPVVVVSVAGVVFLLRAYLRVRLAALQYR